eukprot:9535541-Heterocapsa_arctica.AAC.1
MAAQTTMDASTTSPCSSDISLPSANYRSDATGHVFYNSLRRPHGSIMHLWSWIYGLVTGTRPEKQSHKFAGIGMC